jgi:putative protease
LNGNEPTPNREQRVLAQHKPSAPFIENRDAKYPVSMLTPQDNVTNRLAREFYTVHGVDEIAEGLDCRTSTAGEEVIISDYCLRREIGECLLEKPRLRGDLYLVRGTKKYKLCFDCKACQMKIFDVGR